MRFIGIICSAILAVLSSSKAQETIECSLDHVQNYRNNSDYSVILQEMIDEASRLQNPVVYLDAGIFIIDPENPIILRPGVSLRGSLDLPTIISVNDRNNTGAILVYNDNQGWSIQDIVFENVNIQVKENTNENETAIFSNLFFNGGRGSILAQNGERLFIDGNIFLRDELHAGQERLPTFNGTNAGIMFQAQKNSIVSNNIFGMDLRKMDNLEQVIRPQLERPFRNLRFMHQCLGRNISDEQGYLASGVQLYSTVDITIKENIMNATFPDTKFIAQDHAVSVVGSNQTYVYQNFIAGWQIYDFGGAIRFTSAVDGYVISNYLANTGVMMYVATHADFEQVSNIVVHKNMLYKFFGHDVAPVSEELNGWLYEGITFFDFYTARVNNTILPPIWNSSVPISPWGWHIVISDNRFGASEGLDPNIISLGNLDLAEAYVDRKNCYVTEPFNGNTSSAVVPLLWRQSFQQDQYTRYGARIPQDTAQYTDNDLNNQIPAQFRNLYIPNFWRAFVLKNDTIPMLDPEIPCYI
ncbi:uncharacterized protein BX663DRAFT_476136 [Cokeromyces recurvatus]|uniref:uncharacterized protein n=1 Tax=Cokeromyces recurvatus TaxID=90255 RepID=UPI0022211B95|nr:uncharacterized protein BX663DRAFT_476136 [Cokeromyces recurvatus]KAI7901062.1 hypothetical protein BX663DRAFT_476136 [Cokeromyces recurvatus]